MARRHTVLARMQRTGSLTAAEVERAALEPPLIASANRSFRAPHYIAALLGRLAREGRSPTGRLHTPLDLPLQESLEAEVRHTVDMMRTSGVRHAAVVVLDNHSGGILAWVGSPDFFEPVSGQVDMVISPRQPGSALAVSVRSRLRSRLHPREHPSDVATVYQTSTGPYAPRNYDRRFHGPVRARKRWAAPSTCPRSSWPAGSAPPS